MSRRQEKGKAPGGRVGECDRGSESHRVYRLRRAHQGEGRSEMGHPWGSGQTGSNYFQFGNSCGASMGECACLGDVARFLLLCHPTAAGRRPLRASRPDLSDLPGLMPPSGQGKNSMIEVFKKKILKKCYTVSFECIQKETLEKWKNPSFFQKSHLFAYSAIFFQKV